MGAKVELAEVKVSSRFVTIATSIASAVKNIAEPSRWHSP